MLISRLHNIMFLNSGNLRISGNKHAASQQGIHKRKTRRMKKGELARYVSILAESQSVLDFLCENWTFWPGRRDSSQHTYLQTHTQYICLNHTFCCCSLSPQQAGSCSHVTALEGVGAYPCVCTLVCGPQMVEGNSENSDQQLTYWDCERYASDTDARTRINRRYVHTHTHAHTLSLS